MIVQSTFPDLLSWLYNFLKYRKGQDFWHIFMQKFCPFCCCRIIAAFVTQNRGNKSSKNSKEKWRKKDGSVIADGIVSSGICYVN